jgi:hypothetical protein
MNITTNWKWYSYNPSYDLSSIWTIRSRWPQKPKFRESTEIRMFGMSTYFVKCSAANNFWILSEPNRRKRFVMIENKTRKLVISFFVVLLLFISYLSSLIYSNRQALFQCWVYLRHQCYDSFVWLHLKWIAITRNNGLVCSQWYRIILLNGSFDNSLENSDSILPSTIISVDEMNTNFHIHGKETDYILIFNKINTQIVLIYVDSRRIRRKPRYIITKRFLNIFILELII